MRTKAVIGRFRAAGALSTVATLGTLVVGLWALASAEWVEAAQFLALAALLGTILLEAGGPASARTEYRVSAVVLCSALVFLGLSIVHAINGEVRSAVIGGFAGAVLLVASGLGWYRGWSGRARDLV